MLETIYSNGSTIVKLDPETGSAETTVKGQTVPTLDAIARDRAYRRYMASCDDLSDWRDR